MCMRTPYKSALGVVGLAAAAFAVVYWRSANQPASAPRPISPVPVVTALVQQHDEPIVLSGLGTVQALNTATIHSQVTGVLEQVDFVEGQAVKKGDILAKIDPRLFEAALAQAQGNGPRTLPFTPRRNPISRVFKSLAGRPIALQQVADQQFLVTQDAAAMEADQGLIDTAKTNLAFTTLRAPFDGVTGILQTDIGNLVQPTDTTGIVVLTQMQPIAVVFTLPQADIPSVQAALARGPVAATAYDQAGSKSSTKASFC